MSESIKANKGAGKRSFVFNHKDNNTLNGVTAMLKTRFGHGENPCTIIRNDGVCVALNVGTQIWKEMDLLVKGYLDAVRYSQEDEATVARIAA